jgi:hypothetical protein
MSVNYLKLIPIDPQFVPDHATQEEARVLLTSFLNKADEIRVRFTASIEFINQGANFIKVTCPSCDALLPVDQWGQAMDLAYRSHFSDLSMMMPCCGSRQSLNDLRYDWPAGFARFVLQARDPGADLTQAQVEVLQRLLGCSLRKIWAHW